LTNPGSVSKHVLCTLVLTLGNFKPKWGSSRCIVIIQYIVIVIQYIVIVIQYIVIVIQYIVIVIQYIYST